VNSELSAEIDIRVVAENEMTLGSGSAC